MNTFAKYVTVWLLAILPLFTFAADDSEESRADLERKKLDEVTVVYNRMVGLALSPDELDITHAGTINENGRIITVYSCTPKVSFGFAGQSGALSHMNVMSAFIAYDAEHQNSKARPYFAFPEDIRYVAFGAASTLKNSGGYREVLEDAFVIPIADRDLIHALAKTIFLNQLIPHQAISLQFQGEITKGANGLNFPWRNWNISHFGPLHDSGLMDLDRGIARTNSSGFKIPLGVVIDRAPVALLDSHGRVAVGKFNVGEIVDRSMAQPERWKSRISNEAQALWAAKLVSTPMTRISANASQAPKNVLSANWDPTRWPENLPRPPSAMKLHVKASTIFGRTSGEYRNPNHKLVLKLTDEDGELNFQLVIQNNIRNLVGRPLPFGNRTDSGLFTTPSGEYTDVVNLKIGFDSVRADHAEHGFSYEFMREVPKGVLVITDYEVEPTGELVKLSASIEFEVEGWADVHPKGRLSSRIEFDRNDFRRVNPRQCSDLFL